MRRGINSPHGRRIVVSEYIPGEGCECGAWNKSECGCGADWTPKRQKELEAEVNEQARLLGMSGEREADLRAKIRRLQDQLHAAMWIIEKQKQKEEQQNP